MIKDQLTEFQAPLDNVETVASHMMSDLKHKNTMFEDFDHVTRSGRKIRSPTDKMIGTGTVESARFILSPHDAAGFVETDDRFMAIKEETFPDEQCEVRSSDDSDFEWD